MATSDTLIASGADLTEVIAACERVHLNAQHLGRVICDDELAASDLANLRRAVELASSAEHLGGNDRLEVLWPVFHWAWRLTHSRGAPAITMWHRRRNLFQRIVARVERPRFDDVDRLVHAVSAADAAISKVEDLPAAA